MAPRTTWPLTRLAGTPFGSLHMCTAGSRVSDADFSLRRVAATSHLSGWWPVSPPPSHPVRAGCSEISFWLASRRTRSGSHTLVAERAMKQKRARGGDRREAMCQREDIDERLLARCEPARRSARVRWPRIGGHVAETRAVLLSKFWASRSGWWQRNRCAGIRDRGGPSTRPARQPTDRSHGGSRRWREGGNHA
jgi:hypothetical protein